MPKHRPLPDITCVEFNAVVNKAGRSSIPRRVWKELQLKPGSQARWTVYSPSGLDGYPRLAELAVFMSMTERYLKTGLFDEEFADGLGEQLRALAGRMQEREQKREQASE